MLQVLECLCENTGYDTSHSYILQSVILQAHSASFTTVVLTETMKFTNSSKHLSLVQVTPDFIETMGGGIAADFLVIWLK